MTQQNKLGTPPQLNNNSKVYIIQPPPLPIHLCGLLCGPPASSPLCKHVSRFYNARARQWNNVPLGQVLLDEVKSERHKLKIEQARTILSNKGKKAYAEYKSHQLPCVSLSGTYLRKKVNDTALKDASGCLQGDIDGIDQAEIQRLWPILAADPHVCFVMPSIGRGIKFGIHIEPTMDPDEHILAWTAAAVHYKELTGYDLCPGVKAITSLCFLGSTPILHLNYNTVPLRIPAGFVRPVEPVTPKLPKVPRAPKMGKEKQGVEPEPELPPAPELTKEISAEIRRSTRPVKRRGGLTQAHKWTLVRRIKAWEYGCLTDDGKPFPSHGKFTIAQLHQLFTDWVYECRKAGVLNRGQTDQDYIGELYGSYRAKVKKLVWHTHKVDAVKLVTNLVDAAGSAPIPELDGIFDTYQRKMLTACHALANDNRKGGVFFLSRKTAQELLKCSARQARNATNGLIVSGRIVLLVPGSYDTGLASEYRFIYAPKKQKQTENNN